MIKCNVTVCGTVCRQAQIRANKEGKQFISFGISIVVQAKTGINKTVEISVAKDGDNQAELVNYPVGSRIEVAGVLQFHKKGDALYLNLYKNPSKKDQKECDLYTPYLENHKAQILA